MMAAPPAHRLTGAQMTAEDLVALAAHPQSRISIDSDGLARVVASRSIVDAVVARYTAEYAAGRAGARDYGITTGFGRFKDVPISPDDLLALQANLLPSHAAGVGASTDPLDPASYFGPEVVRAVLLLRINAFLKGHSGVRPALLQALIDLFHAGIVPQVPIRGSLGASGDLCPLAHLFLPLVGQGWFLAPGHAGWLPGARLGEFISLPTPAISFKEGLALINGATFSAALLAFAVVRAEHLVEVADGACALALEGIAGCARAFDARIHAARNHPGQQQSAARIRQLIEGSRGIEARGEVQDPYCVRCAPAVHGATRDALRFVASVVEAELNAATDNPLFFNDNCDPFDALFEANWPAGYDGRERHSFSAGNFHGQPIALAADLLTLAVAELGSISERRTQMLLDAHHNHGLPPNLTARPGVQSGYMIAQYTAASLVSENKVLAHPAVVDSIPSSANIEDHVPMALVAARKLQTVVHNVTATLAIELLVGTQAVEWRHLQGADFATAECEAIAARLGQGTAALYRQVRGVVPRLVDDRVLSDDIRAVQRLVERGT